MLMQHLSALPADHPVHCASLVWPKRGLQLRQGPRPLGLVTRRLDGGVDLGRVRLGLLQIRGGAR